MRISVLALLPFVTGCYTVGAWTAAPPARAVESREPVRLGQEVHLTSDGRGLTAMGESVCVFDEHGAERTEESREIAADDRPYGGALAVEGTAFAVGLGVLATSGMQCNASPTGCTAGTQQAVSAGFGTAMIAGLLLASTVITRNRRQVPTHVETREHFAPFVRRTRAPERCADAPHPVSLPMTVVTFVGGTQRTEWHTAPEQGNDVQPVLVKIRALATWCGDVKVLASVDGAREWFDVAGASHEQTIAEPVRLTVHAPADVQRPTFQQLSEMDPRLVPLARGCCVEAAWDRCRATCEGIAGSAVVAALGACIVACAKEEEVTSCGQP